jgi:phospholipid/cholesterol/gamma-HCH transport system substrate-binding protein
MPQSHRRLEFVVGAFMLVGLACLAYLAVRVGDAPLLGDDRYELQARFTSVSGLKQGAFVELAGVRVGTVTAIEVDPTSYLAVVHMALGPQVRLQTDTIASIRTAGIIGDKFVKLSPGGAEDFLGPGDRIRETEPAISLEELISKYIFESKR